jgi:hypothetical protein
MRKSSLVRSFALICFSGSVFVQLSSGQACLSGNSMLNNVYAYVATVAGPSGSSSTSPGYSNTEVGRLLGSIAASGPFSAAGLFAFDGNGHILASAVPQGGMNQSVGTYNVNPDCTVAVSLKDPFGTISTAQTLVGIVLDGGTEIDLGPPAAAPSATNQFASSLAIKLIRPLYPSGCSVGSLNGPYALVSRVTFQAVAVNPPGTGNIASLAIVHFDGGGNIIADPIVSPSSLAMFQYTGTYTVNSDCTGTMTLSSGPGAPGGSIAKFPSALSISFIITPATISLGAPNPVGDQSRPGLELVMSNGTQTANGYGRPL